MQHINHGVLALFPVQTIRLRISFIGLNQCMLKNMQEQIHTNLSIMSCRRATKHPQWPNSTEQITQSMRILHPLFQLRRTKNTASSPWAKARNFTYRYHLGGGGGQILSRIFKLLYICRYYFGMITIPDW